MSNTIKITRRVVVNACHGGFGISEVAANGLAQRKGCRAVNRHEPSYPYWYLVSEELGLDIDVHDLPRDDVDLVDTVQQLGKRANGPSADLRIQTVTVEINLDSHDGRETVSVSGWAG